MSSVKQLARFVVKDKTKKSWVTSDIHVLDTCDEGWTLKNKRFGPEGEKQNRKVKRQVNR